MTFDAPPFDFLRGLILWSAGVFSLMFVASLVMLIVSVATNGREGFGLFLNQFLGGMKDMVRIAPRRVGAIARLTTKEAIRRKALAVFFVFAVLFMFAGWFFSNSGSRIDLQVEVYINFVLKAITWLILPVMLLLACWGLPEDIRTRNLHTVVTKPTRRVEIVIGRVLGFIWVGTMVLVGMATVGCIWIVRQVPEDGKEFLICRVPIYGELAFRNRAGDDVQAGINVGDVWTFRSYIDGASQARGIWTFDNITPARMGDSIDLESRFEAFRTHKGQKMDVPVHIQYAFINPLNTRAAKSLSSIPAMGGIQGAITDGEFGKAGSLMQTLGGNIEKQSLPLSASELERLESGFREFVRLLTGFSEKQSSVIADMKPVTTAANACVAAARSRDAVGFGKALHGLGDQFVEHQALLKKQLVDKTARLPSFPIQEFKFNREQFGRTVSYTEKGSAQLIAGDLFDDIIHNNQLRVEVRCVDAGQYLGLARPDLFIRLPDRPFISGYLKSIFGIWLMMSLLVLFGVTASCFAKGPVATFLTLNLMLLGTLFHEFMKKLAEKEVEGGGTFESAFRLVKHLNPKVEIDPGSGAWFMQAVDSVFNGFVWLMYNAVPNFKLFTDLTVYVAKGYDVPWSNGLLPCIMTVIGYTIPCLLLANYSLRGRELEAK